MDEERTPVTALENSQEPHHDPTVSQEVSSELLTELPPEVSARPADLHERFAAFFTDLILFAYLLGGWALALKFLTRGDLTAPFSFRGGGGPLFLSPGVAPPFLYFF